MEEDEKSAMWEVAARAKEVFCHGDLLSAVQRLCLFEDCKTFVDMPQKQGVKETLAAFVALTEDQKQSSTEMRSFVDQHFSAPGHDLLPSAQLTIMFITLYQVRVGELREWAREIHHLWPELVREVLLLRFIPTCLASAAASNFSAHILHHRLASPTSLHDRHPVVVPGGRFRESYYWDSYWSVKGLLVSGMLVTARGVVENLLEDVERFGMVPNGGRIYYTQRSQPPLLSEMVCAIYEASLDDGFLAKALPLLETEYKWWMSPEGSRVVMVGKHQLNRYWSAARVPRPESFREDEATSKLGGEAVLPHLTAAAESGWDFSTRWMVSDEGGHGLQHTNTCNTIPADLNALLYRMELNLARLGKAREAREVHEGVQGRARPLDYSVHELGDTPYGAAASRRAEAMKSLMWCQQERRWCDLTVKQVEPPATEEASLEGRAAPERDVWAQSTKISAASFIPLWAGLEEGKEVVQGLHESGLVLPGGVSTSLQKSGEQWDHPNAWAPVQWMIIEGLEMVGTAQSKELANSLAQRWLSGCHIAWKATGAMHEKYSAAVLGETGKGGEYKPQLGFAWTNGVALDLLVKYANAESSQPHPN
ncbi:unnamed protein product [Chrysoparadoxa australica]